MAYRPTIVSSVLGGSSHELAVKEIALFLLDEVSQFP